MSEAASAAPVGPVVTSASARPSPRACAARTIEAVDFERAAWAGSSKFVMSSGASTTSTRGADSPSAARISAAGPNSRQRVPREAASVAAAVTSARPRSAPSASTATVATGPPRSRPQRPPGARRSSRTRGRPGAEAAANGTAGTNSKTAPRPCAGSGACWCASAIVSAWGEPYVKVRMLAKPVLQQRAAGTWAAAAKLF